MYIYNKWSVVVSRPSNAVRGAACLDPETTTLLAAFEDRSLPVSVFKHAQHVQLAWAMLAVDTLFTALRRFRSGLKAYTGHNGVPGLYNETITCFYLLLIRDRMDRQSAGQPWTEFRLHNPDLFLHPKVLLANYYPQESAFAAAAKQDFQLPPCWLGMPAPERVE